MSDGLPCEVTIDIISRLPVKSLMRFRCVSKAWCSLISTPHFISTHLNRSLSNSQHPPCLFLSHYDNKPNYSGIIHTLLLYLDQEIEQKGDFFRYPSDRIEFRGIHQRIEYVLHLVGSSNGLLCLANRVFNNENELCVLWNPSIQKAISLPEPNIGFHDSLNHSVGFGYEPMTDDYKLVRLVYLRGTDHIAFNNVPPLVEIYTLRTGIWRSITAPGPPYMMKMSSSSVFVSGAVHWPAHTLRGQGAFRNVIMSFNMKDEAFGEMAMPESLQGITSLNVAVAVVDGLLALVPCNEFGNKASQAVWVMKEYGVTESWTKLFDIDIGGFRRVIGTKSGEVLVNKAARLFSFGPSSGGYLELPICGLHDIYLDTYVESLVLLNVAD
ncbi:F-box/kelch-repeat protein At3g06240-like [Corylus avellana]|uniref:F-box/kelch-repeat protein At3g06240-like n=1 Tax=Corylus avellana TaxID=13451 RepID=UPI001E201672|nr:F-box/kelch-repeat protein At3g06240-like [Corylus avellana]